MSVTALQQSAEPCCAENPREADFFAFAAAILERFPGSRVSWLRLASVPKYELGGELQQWMRENPDRVETYERGMWGFGRLPDDGPKPTPWVPRDTEKRSPKIPNAASDSAQEYLSG